MPTSCHLRQTTGWDCVPKAFEAALVSAFGWHKVPLEALKTVYRLCIDLEDGTSRGAIMATARRLASVPGVATRRLTGGRGSPGGIVSELRLGRSVVLPTWVEDEGELWPHGVAAVGTSSGSIRVADPWRPAAISVPRRRLETYMDRSLFTPVAVWRA